MDGSSEQPQMTAGLDLGDKYSYLCLIDQESGEVIEEGKLRTTPEAFRRRFASEQPRAVFTIVDHENGSRNAPRSPVHLGG
jgi:hypothetical protein